MIQTKRIGIQHLIQLKPIQFIELMNYFKDELKGVLTKDKVTITEKVDGFGLRFGVDEKNKFFIESSHSGAIYDEDSFYNYAKQKTNDDFRLKIAKGYDNILKKLKSHSKLNSLLTQYNSNGVKVIGECFYSPLAIYNKDNKIKFLSITYDKSKLGELMTFIIFDVIDGEGKQHPDKQQITDKLKKLSDKQIKFDTPDIQVNDINIKVEIDNFFKLLSKYKDIERVLKSRKKVDKPLKDELKQLIYQYQLKIADKIIKTVNKGKFGDEFEGIVLDFLNKGKFKIITNTFKQNKQQYNKIYKEHYYPSFKTFLLLFEGGNLEVSGIQATTIDLSKTDRKKIVSDLIKMIKQLNKLFKQRYGYYLWCDEKVIDNLTIFSGSTKHFLNQSIPDDEFKKVKPTVGDIDVQVPEVYQTELVELLKKDLTVGKFKYIGRNNIGNQISTLWEYNGLYIQIDFEFEEFKDLVCPTDWARFAHSSDWNDLKKGIKGVFHKYLVGAIDFKTQKTIWLVKGKRKPKIGKVTVHPFAFSVAKGLRAKYTYYLDENGEKVYKDGEPVYRELSTKESKYIKDLSAIFEILFERKPSENDLKLMWSFTGLLHLIRGTFKRKQIELIYKEFLNRLWGRGAQKLYKGDSKKDLQTKVVAQKYFVEQFKYLQSFNNLVEEMLEKYYKK